MACGGGGRRDAADAGAGAGADADADCGRGGEDGGSGGGERLDYSSAFTSPVSSLLPSLISGSRSSNATAISCSPSSS